MIRVLRCCCIPGLQAVAVYRYGQWAKQRQLLLRIVADPIYLILNLFIKLAWGIGLPRSAKIGPGFYIGHFGGIQISSEAKIGANCNLSQEVTIGVSGRADRRGVPTIGNNVYIAPGAKVFGLIKVGNNVKIGANAVIYSDIPDNAVVVLYPGYKIISMTGNPNENRVE